MREPSEPDWPFANRTREAGDSVLLKIEHGSQGAVGGTETSAFRAMRVLVADDQRDVGTSLADLVRHCNHEIVGVVGSGLEAIQAYAKLHPDVVLMDYWMPKLNGATACRNILSKDPTARVILVSAWSPSAEACASGAFAVLPKPIDFDRLNATLHEVAESLPAADQATVSSR